MRLRSGVEVVFCTDSRLVEASAGAVLRTKRLDPGEKDERDESNPKRQRGQLEILVNLWRGQTPGPDPLWKHIGDGETTRMFGNLPSRIITMMKGVLLSSSLVTERKLSPMGKPKLSSEMTTWT